MSGWNLPQSVANWLSDHDDEIQASRVVPATIYDIQHEIARTDAPLKLERGVGSSKYPYVLKIDTSCVDGEEVSAALGGADVLEFRGWAMAASAIDAVNEFIADAKEDYWDTYQRALDNQT